MTWGYYVLDGELLTMTDGNGAAFRAGLGGDKVTHRLQAGEDPNMVAQRLTRRIYTMVRGDMNGFNRRIDYPPIGWI